MPAITTNDLKNGITLELDNGLFQVVEFQHVKPGKGGAFVRTKLRNVRTGNVLDRTFNAGVRVEQAILDRRTCSSCTATATTTCSWTPRPTTRCTSRPAPLGDAADYLVEQAVAQIAPYHGEIVGVEIPASVELTIAETEPGMQGDRVSGARKPADARDRQGRPGAAVHQRRRPGEGRHPLRRVHHSGLTIVDA